MKDKKTNMASKPKPHATCVGNTELKPTFRKSKHSKVKNVVAAVGQP